MDILLYTLLAIIILLLLPREVAKTVLLIVAGLIVLAGGLVLILIYLPKGINWGTALLYLIALGVVPILWKNQKEKQSGQI